MARSLEKYADMMERDGGKKTMKAYLLRGRGNFTYADVDKPACGRDDVIVKVRAAGICGSDIPRIYGNSAYAYSLIPGHEFSGIVMETGMNVDRSWIGKRVGIFPLIPCGTCTACKIKQYELCRSYSYLGSRTDGGFAEYVAAPAWNLIELPKEVSFEQAAMLEPMAVAAHAMRRAGAKQGQTAAICGLGTIGLLLYMLLKENGLDRIYLIGNPGHQEEMAAGLGFDMHYFCHSRAKDADEWFAEMSIPGADLFFDCAGTDESAGLALRHTVPGGTAALIGNPASDMRFDRQSWWKILRNQLTVRGSWNSSFMHEDSDDWHYCLNLLARKRVLPEKLISHRFPFERLSEGTELMRDKKEGYTKIMAFL